MNLNLTKIPMEKRDKAKQEAGEFLVGEILRFVSRGQSPVQGERFPKLDEEYAKREKRGDTTPNLELEGDLLDSLEFRLTPDGVSVGIFKSSELGKADGHNNFSGLSKLPQRRFIPKADQKFKNIIESGINQILDGYRVDETGVSLLDLEDDFLVTSARNVIAEQGITIEQVISDFIGGSTFE